MISLLGFCRKLFCNKERRLIETVCQFSCFVNSFDTSALQTFTNALDAETALVFDELEGAYPRWAEFRGRSFGQIVAGQSFPAPFVKRHVSLCSKMMPFIIFERPVPDTFIGCQKTLLIFRRGPLEKVSGCQPFEQCNPIGQETANLIKVFSKSGGWHRKWVNLTWISPIVGLCKFI